MSSYHSSMGTVLFWQPSHNRNHPYRPPYWSAVFNFNKNPPLGSKPTTTIYYYGNDELKQSDRLFLTDLKPPGLIDHPAHLHIWWADDQGPRLQRAMTGVSVRLKTHLLYLCQWVSQSGFGCHGIQIFSNTHTVCFHCTQKVENKEQSDD